MPRCWAQAVPPIIRLGAQGAQRLRHLDLALGQHGSVGRPLPLGPVRRPLRVGGELDPLQPLGGRHEPEQTRYDHPRREPVGVGQRLPVHPDGDHRVAAVADRGVRGRAGVAAVGGVAEHLVHAGLDPDPVEDLAERHPEPAGRADVLSADLVGDAGHRDVPLDHRQLEQLVVAELQRAVDPAVDGQLPGADVDPRRDQGDVHPVEGVVGGGEGLHAGHLDTVGDRAAPPTSVAAAGSARGPPAGCG